MGCRQSSYPELKRKLQTIRQSNSSQTKTLTIDQERYNHQRHRVPSTSTDFNKNKIEQQQINSSTGNPGPTQETYTTEITQQQKIVETTPVSRVYDRVQRDRYAKSHAIQIAGTSSQIIEQQK